MRPFECNRCHARTYSEKTPKVCELCKFEKFSELVSICLLLPVEVEPTFPVVHESGEVPSDDGGVKSVIGQKWVLACKSSTLPQTTTPEPEACTCFHCKKWLGKRMAELASSLPEKIEEPSSDNLIEIEFEGFDDDEALAEIESSEPDKLP